MGNCTTSGHNDEPELGTESGIQQSGPTCFTSGAERGNKGSMMKYSSTWAGPVSESFGVGAVKEERSVVL